MRILTVVGNRPQFIKAAAVSGPLRERHEEVLVHTGQHHDDTLSRVFFAELGLARPDRELAISGGTNGSQTARMLAALEPLLAESEPDAVLVYGDTNSTLAGALAAAQARFPVIHVEAGMRSFDRTMPEELNRVLTDHIAELLLCSSDTAAANLREGVRAGRGGGRRRRDGGRRDAPAARRASRSRSPARARARARQLPAGDRPPRRQRGRPGAPRGARRAARPSSRRRCCWRCIRARPRDSTSSASTRTLRGIPGLVLSEPLGYLEFSALLCQSRAVVTDSGGVQKEAYLAGVPCVTLRASTEWVETVEAGWNTLVDLDAAAAVAALERPAPGERPQLYGDGHAAERCVAAIDELASRLTGAPA